MLLVSTTPLFTYVALDPSE